MLATTALLLGIAQVGAAYSVSEILPVQDPIPVWPGILPVQDPIAVWPGEELYPPFECPSALSTPEFNPVGSLSAVRPDAYTTLTHPLFTRHSVRIKQSTDFCDTTVNSYTGYIDVDAKHLFFYFFESRSNPDKDDVLFWTNGGPGCSSQLGLYMELGPCRVVNATEGPKFHPESWNSNANVFFVDQPVGVGYSYAEHGITVGTTEEAADDIAAFIAIFFENFSSFKGRSLHLAGESYGGRYIPLFAAAVYDQNALLAAVGGTPINLTSGIIGNGFTDPAAMLPSFHAMTCTPASLPPVLDISTCVRMKKALPRCQKWYKTACVDQFDSMSCHAANAFCETELLGPYELTGGNPYDISKSCEDPDALCYPVTNSIVEYLNRPDVLDALGVDPHVRGFASCSDSVAFLQSADDLRPSVDYVEGLLERGVAVLIYVGTYDWICNWVGNEQWTLDMDWSGKDAFGRAPLRAWEVDGAVAGKTRSAAGLTFATVDAAGHMVPYDKPKQALALINRWLAKEPL
ncbi:serine carboxypeptidase [Auriscalpium vulgare]|uniref:Serine carboxypeptidase n=1 Tax=Auriscalpium vulgare TaxID=40419 RepID=A0ACB8RBM6_9AGAM|nr:serine carboxypeptidase [Auriscalpium vulgare]